MNVVESIGPIESIESNESTATNEVCSVCYELCHHKTECNHLLCKTCFGKLEIKQCPICRNVLKKRIDVLDILIEEMNGGCVFELIRQKRADQLEEWLIQRPEDTCLTKIFGQTLLHEACIYASEDCVKMLIKRGANVRATNEMGLTPLHLACANKNVEIVCELIKAGADKYAKTSANNTPLDHAKMWNTENIFTAYLC
jgi:ankyrin repeat protein